MAGRAPILQKLVGRVILAILGTTPQLVGILILLTPQILQELAHDPFLAAGAEPEIQYSRGYDDAQTPKYNPLDQPFAALISDSVGVQIAGHGSIWLPGRLCRTPQWRRR